MVDRAAPSGVVPGEPGGAAVLGASSGFAEGAHHRFGAGGASAIASQHNHAWIVPPPKQGKLFSAWPYLAGRARWGRVGSVAACRVLLPCGTDRYGWARAGWAWPEGLGPTGACAWSVAGPGLAPPDQPGSARRSRGAGSREPARSAAVDPGPGGRLDAGELFAWVGGSSSVSLTCSCADQGGCHVDMVVGADHRGRCRVGVRRDAEPSPLTAPLPARSRLALLLDQADGLAAGRCVQAQQAPPTTQRCPARRARLRSRGWASGARPPRAVRC
jgi:hypothetical protein